MPGCGRQIEIRVVYIVRRRWHKKASGKEEEDEKKNRMKKKKREGDKHDVMNDGMGDELEVKFNTVSLRLFRRWAYPIQFDLLLASASENVRYNFFIRC